MVPVEDDLGPPAAATDPQRRWTPDRPAASRSRRGRSAGLATVRQRQGLSVIQLAVMARVSETTIRRLEQGRGGPPRPQTAMAIAAALGVDPGAIPELCGPTGRRPQPGGRGR